MADDDDTLRKLWREVSLLPKHEIGRSQDPMIQGTHQANRLRNLFYLADLAKQKKRISEYCFYNLASEYMDEYSKIVDNFDGLNNYADEALEIARSKGYANESRKWVSFLHNASEEDILNILPQHTPQGKVPVDEDVQKLLKCFKNSLLNVPNKQANVTSTDDHSRKSAESCQSNFKPTDSSSSLLRRKQSVITDSFQQSAQGVSHHKPNFNNVSNVFSASDRTPGTGSTRTYDVPVNKRKHSPDTCNKSTKPVFKTARDKLISDDIQKNGSRGNNSGSLRKSLGSRRNVGSSFTPPFATKTPAGFSGNKQSEQEDEEITDERLKNIDPKMVELMNNEIMDRGPPVTWGDIAGLEFAKKTIQEIVVWPLLRPDLFTGLRGPPKGILLFGPPGTGKTLIGKCIASQSKSTFFCISASSITSKWVGEGEKLVRALFAVARCNQPAVIFIDEIDSLLTQRSDSEHESSRRIKTEFLVQLDGASTATDERLLIVGATNRPQELDEAARRRLVKRLYIPLPDGAARQEIVEKLIGDQNHSLTKEHLGTVRTETEGYSGADMANLCKEAALGPMRDLNFADIEHIKLDQVRPIGLQDFINALKQVRASVSDKDLQLYQDWNSKYGSVSL